MPAPSKPQLAIYAAAALAVLLIGARFLHSGGGDGDGAAPAYSASAGSASGSAGSAQARRTSAGADGTEPPPAGTAGAPLVVDVKGAVRRPGVYRLAAGARALDAVRRAGGLTHRADRVGVNLAARVVDGGEVVVPQRGRGAPPAGAGAGDASTGSDSGAPLSIDLDTATEQQLEQLDGVGPATAAKIVAYRSQHGGIGSVDQLDDVPGIGPAKLAAIRAQLGR